jgi:hypothetical protein
MQSCTNRPADLEDDCKARLHQLGSWRQAVLHDGQQQALKNFVGTWFRHALDNRFLGFVGGSFCQRCFFFHPGAPEQLDVLMP